MNWEQRFDEWVNSPRQQITDPWNVYVDQLKSFIQSEIDKAFEAGRKLGHKCAGVDITNFEEDLDPELKEALQKRLDKAKEEGRQEERLSPKRYMRDSDGKWHAIDIQKNITYVDGVDIVGMEKERILQIIEEIMDENKWNGGVNIVDWIVRVADIKESLKSKLNI